jgi:copper transport protein
MTMRGVRWLFLVGLLAILGVLPVSAHGYLLRSIPADRSVLERPPTRLQYWFSEDLEADFSTLILRDAQGNILAQGGLDPQNATLMTLQIPPNLLTDGAYIVELRPAFSSDGHASLATQVFFVGDSRADVASVAISDQAQGLEVLWKSLLLCGLFVAFGACLLYSDVLLPAWGNPKYEQGQLPPRVMERLNALMWAGLGLAIFGNLIALIQQTMILFNVSAEQAVTGGLWQVVRIGSRFGDVWNIRMVFLVIVLAIHVGSLLYRDRYPRSVKAFWGANVWCLSLVIGAQAITSHAAGSLVMPWVGVAMHWLHSLATAFWVGGIVVLVWVLPIALQPYTGELRQQALLRVMNRMSRLLIGVLIVVITTGIYNSTNWFFAPQDLQSTYGSALGLKLLLVGLLVAMGALHHVALRPHLLIHVQTRLPASFINGAKQFANSLRLEAIIAMLALISASLLSSTPIPQPSFLQSNIPPQTQTMRVNDYEVTLTITPGGVGLNTYDVVVVKDNLSVEDVRVNVQFSNPQRDQRGNLEAAQSLGEGLYVTSGTDITALGEWWTSIDVLDAENGVTRVAFAWQIGTDSTIITSLAPSWLGIVSAFGVVFGLGVVLYPSAYRLYQQFNLTPQNIVVAVGIIAISVAMLWFSVWFLGRQREAQDMAQNPPPTRINPTLPTQDSLDRGEALYYERCVIWQSVTDFRAFMNQVDQLRDEVVYEAVTSGWRDMPACNDTFSEQEVWDVVNFVRVLQRTILG